ncbi:DUF6461 domain-containing protein [Streptomyces sp. NPDC004838]
MWTGRSGGRSASCARRSAGPARGRGKARGFRLKEEAPETDLSSPAAFALAEHLTGIAVTPALLQDTTFCCATVQLR